MRSRPVICGGLIAICAGLSLAWGGEPALPLKRDSAIGNPFGDSAPRRSQNASPARRDQIRGWVKDLDSDAFATREAASAQLIKAGAAAIDAIAAAVESKSPEVSMRAMRILEQLYESPDTVSRSASQRALAMIATNAASLGAKRAKEILSPPNIAAPPELAFRRGRRGGRGGWGAQVSTFQSHIVNGRKTIDAETNARKVHIEEEPDGAITIHVSEWENGRDQTRDYAAKSLDDLTKNQPDEARQLYQQYMPGAVKAPPQIDLRPDMIIFGPGR